MESLPSRLAIILLLHLIILFLLPAPVHSDKGTLSLSLMYEFLYAVDDFWRSRWYIGFIECTNHILIQLNLWLIS